MDMDTIGAIAAIPLCVSAAALAAQNSRKTAPKRRMTIRVGRADNDSDSLHYEEG